MFMYESVHEAQSVILNMLSDGKINACEAEKLLNAINSIINSINSEKQYEQWLHHQHHPWHAHYRMDKQGEENLDYQANKLFRCISEFKDSFFAFAGNTVNTVAPHVKKATKHILQKTAKMAADLVNKLSEGDCQSFDDSSECNCGCDCDCNCSCENQNF